MAKLLILLACVAAFHAVNALECYKCDSTTCKKEMKEWEKVTCGKSADQNQEPACQKIVFKDKEGNKNVERKCVTVQKTGTTDCPALPTGATESNCPVCKTDLCNAAPTVSLSLTAVAGIVLVLLGQKYLL